MEKTQRRWLLIRLPGLWQFLYRIWNQLFSEETFNTLVNINFHYGYYSLFFMIKKPEMVHDEFGTRVKVTPNVTVFRKIAMKSVLYFMLIYNAFEILQLVRFIPKEGINRRTISVIFYFSLTFVGFVFAKAFDDHSLLLAEAYEMILSLEKYCMRLGGTDARFWRKQFIVIMFLLSVTFAVYVIVPTMILFFMVKPNNTAHIFFLLPEAWKPYTLVYLVMVLLQAFLFSFLGFGVVGMLTIGVSFLYCSKTSMMVVVKNDFRRHGGIKISERIKIIRAVVLLDRMANEVVAGFVVPMVTLWVIVTAVLFTYIGITRFDDPNMDKIMYFVVVAVDVVMLFVITGLYTEAGKYEDTSLLMINCIRASLDDVSVIRTGRWPLYKRYIKTLKKFGLHCSTFAMLNDETTKLMHETIIDYLILLLSK